MRSAAERFRIIAAIERANADAGRGDVPKHRKQARYWTGCASRAEAVDAAKDREMATTTPIASPVGEFRFVRTVRG